MTTAAHYFEAHVTTDWLDPEGDLYDGYVRSCSAWSFRPAKLVLRKGASEEPHTGDTFCTARSTDLLDILERTDRLVRLLGLCGVHVRRYKVESTILDVRP